MPRAKATTKTSKPIAKEPAPTPAVARLNARRGAKQKAILHAAGLELVENGYVGANLDRIAESVYITKATLYHYFATKRDLYLAWIDMVHSETMDRLRPTAQQILPPVDLLVRLVEQYSLILMIEFPGYVRLFLNGADWPDDLRDVIHEHRESSESLFKSVIDQGVLSGDFIVEDATVARLSVQGALAYLPEWFRPGSRLGAGAVAELMAATALRIMGMPAEGASQAARRVLQQST